MTRAELLNQKLQEIMINRIGLLSVNLTEFSGGYDVQGTTLQNILNEVFPEGYNNKTMIDIGCGQAPMSQQFIFQKSTFVDIVPDGCPQPFYQADAVEFLLSQEPFDILFALDFIEHLSKNKGYELLNVIEHKIKGAAIFFTPEGNLGVREEGSEYHPNWHWSEWYPKDFSDKGYNTINFPNYHNPWSVDGKVHGSFFSWKNFR